MMNVIEYFLYLNRSLGMCKRCGDLRMIACSKCKGVGSTKSGGLFGINILADFYESLSESNVPSIPCMRCNAKGRFQCPDCSSQLTQTWFLFLDHFILILLRRNENVPIIVLILKYYSLISPLFPSFSFLSLEALKFHKSRRGGEDFYLKFHKRRCTKIFELFLYLGVSKRPLFTKEKPS